MAEYELVTQPFLPVYDKNSKILILGSFPSVKSREQGFYYGHPRNRFWKVLSAILEVEEPVTIEAKKKMLLEHGIAIYDVIEQCRIKGSSDSSIRDVVPADIKKIINESSIEVIITNGKLASKLYNKYQKDCFKGRVIEMPSTSPANAAYSLERLVEIWKVDIKSGR